MAQTYIVAEGLPQARLMSAAARSRATAGGAGTEHQVGNHRSRGADDLDDRVPATSSALHPLSGAGPRALIAQQALRRPARRRARTSAETALARLRALGIRWYVVAEKDRRGPRWDPERRRAFSSTAWLPFTLRSDARDPRATPRFWQPDWLVLREMARVLRAMLPTLRSR